ADVFALGVLLWEAIAGRRLFHGENETETLARVLMCDVPLLESVAPDAPPALCAIAKRALAYDASARFGSAREMQEALEAALRDAGVDVGPREIAATLAHLLPDRVREHERWLKEPIADDGAMPVGAVARAMEPTRVEARASR